MPRGRRFRCPRRPSPYDRQWLPLHDAAAVAHVTPSFLRREILLGRMPAQKGPDGWLIDRDVVEVFITFRVVRDVAWRERPSEANEGPAA